MQSYFFVLKDRHYCQSVQSNQFSLSDLRGLSVCARQMPTKRPPKNVASGWEGLDYCFSLGGAKASGFITYYVGGSQFRTVVLT